MLPEGTYRAQGIQASLTAAGNGTEQVAVVFNIVDPAEFVNQKITWFGFFTEKTLERTFKALRLCGWEGDNLADLSGVDANQVDIVVEHESYEGKTRARVLWVNEAGSGGVAIRPMAEAQAKAFAAKLRAKVLAFDKKQGAPKPAASRPPASRAVDEGADVPF